MESSIIQEETEDVFIREEALGKILNNSDIIESVLNTSNCSSACISLELSRMHVAQKALKSFIILSFFFF